MKLQYLELENIGPFKALKLETAPVVYLLGPPNTGKTWIARSALEIYDSLLGQPRKYAPQGVVHSSAVNWNQESSEGAVTAGFLDASGERWETSLGLSRDPTMPIATVSELRIATKRFAISFDTDSYNVRVEGPRGGLKASAQLEDSLGYFVSRGKTCLYHLAAACSRGRWGKNPNPLLNNPLPDGSLDSITDWTGFGYDYLGAGHFKYPVFINPSPATSGDWGYRLPHVLNQMETSTFKEAKELIENYGEQSGLFARFRFRHWYKNKKGDFAIEVRHRRGRKLGDWENIAASSVRTTQGFIRAGVLATNKDGLLHLDHPDSAMCAGEVQAFADIVAATASDSQVLLLELNSATETSSYLAESLSRAGIQHRGYHLKYPPDSPEVVCSSLGSC